MKHKWLIDYGFIKENRDSTGIKYFSGAVFRMRRIFLVTILFFLAFGEAESLNAGRNICFVLWRHAAVPENWHYSPAISPDRLTLFQRLDKVIQEHHGTFLVSDLGEFLQPGGSRKFQAIDTFIFWDSATRVGFDWRRRLFQEKKQKIIAILSEPPTVQAKLYQPSFLSFCDEALTWNDSLVDNKKFFKFYYPVLSEMDANLVSFSQKKLLTMVCRNKTSSHPKELYSERLKVIRYFEKQKSRDFEFYGYGWKASAHSTYRGEVQDKHAVLKQYRFSICYENMKDVRGYITEKIFDSFAAGCVPVYCGASNVADYIPRNCFIARQDFSSFGALVEYLRNMKEDEYNRYLENIRLFLESPAAQKFSRDNLYAALVERLKLADNK
jgi:hypothetical protein